MTWFTSGTGIRVLRLDPLDRKERLGLGKELLTEIEDLGIVEKQVLLHLLISLSLLFRH